MIHLIPCGWFKRSPKGGQRELGYREDPARDNSTLLELIDCLASSLRDGL